MTRPETRPSSSGVAPVDSLWNLPGWLCHRRFWLYSVPSSAWDGISPKLCFVVRQTALPAGIAPQAGASALDAGLCRGCGQWETRSGLRAKRSFEEMRSHAELGTEGKATLPRHRVALETSASTFRPPLPRERRDFRRVRLSGERVGVRGPKRAIWPSHPGPLTHSGVLPESSTECGGEGAELRETPCGNPSRLRPHQGRSRGCDTLCSRCSPSVRRHGCNALD